jgi:hypothetical protein
MMNVGMTDRIVRIVAGVAMLTLGFGGFVTGNAGLALKILGFVPLLTAAAGICPLYLPFGLSTGPRK